MIGDKEFDESTICPLCGNRANTFSVSESNLRFLRSRTQEKNVNEAVNICAIAWNMFPELRLHNNAKEIVDLMLENIQQQLAKALVPLEMIAKLTSPLNEKLEGLIEKLPQDVKKQFQEITIQLAKETKTVQEIAKNSTEPIQKDLKDLAETINLLVNKPSIKGLANEQTLQLGWQETFIKDKIVRKGGAGQADLVVTPYLEFSGSRYGSKIVVERKAGAQKYSGSHLAEAIMHSKAEGSKFCILVYDSPANLLELQKPVYLTMSDGITLAISDVQTGGWRTSRQVIEVIQITLPADNAETASRIDIKRLQEAIQQIAGLNNQIELLRKNNNSAIANCEKTRENISRLEELVFCHQQSLQNLLLEKPSSLNPSCNSR